jgi:hypothetical protein
MKEEFIEFLKTWGVYEKFMANVTEDDWDLEFSTRFVNDAFNWHKSKEGYDFWAKLEDTWLDYLNYWSDDNWLYKAL